MRKEKVRQDNINFFVLAVGIASLSTEFKQIIATSLNEISEFMIKTPRYIYPGRIKVDSSDILKVGTGLFYNPEDAYYDFRSKIEKGDLLRKIANSLLDGNNAKFQGKLAEKVTVQSDNCLFSFYIKEYKRDLEHKFEVISPEVLLSNEVPENEEISRIVSLTISPDK